VVVAVVVVLGALAWWWSRSRGAGTAPPVAARRSIDREVRSLDEQAPMPIVPPPGGPGVPMTPLVPTFDPDDSEAPPPDSDDGPHRALGEEEPRGD
jgi:hypothetical protein